LTYLPQPGDLPGPLINTLTVTGTNTLQVITATAQANVALHAPIVRRYLPFILHQASCLIAPSDGNC